MDPGIISDYEKGPLKGMSYTLYCILGTLIYYILSAIPAILCLYIPDYDTSKCYY